jgi:molecular chaperone HscB
MTERKSRSGRPSTVTGDMVSCWLCSQPVSQRALFCHHCGTVQPPRVLDPFTRLGLPIRFDVDSAVLERQFTGFRRTLAPERFTDKGPREKSNARAHLDALQHAYDTLRDPVRRARYLLDMARTTAVGNAAPIDPELVALEAEAAETDDTVALDRLANRAARGIEQCILDLSAAFRADELGSAAGAMARLERLEALAATIRERRQRLPEGSA